MLECDSDRSLKSKASALQNASSSGSRVRFKIEACLCLCSSSTGFSGTKKYAFSKVLVQKRKSSLMIFTVILSTGIERR